MVLESSTRENFISLPSKTSAMSTLLVVAALDPSAIPPQLMGQVMDTSKFPVLVSKLSTTTKYEPASRLVETVLLNPQLSSGASSFMATKPPEVASKIATMVS